MSDFLKNVSGRLQSVVALVTSAGAGDAGKIVKTNGSGTLDITLMPAGLGADTQGVLASEALAAGNLVNIYNNTGTLNVRKADASNDRPAHGFVLAAFSNAQTATVYFSRKISGLTGLTPGARYWLSDSTAGGLTTTPPTTGATKISQYVGTALSATELAFEPDEAILLS